MMTKTKREQKKQANKIKLLVTDHAIIRYLERVIGLDIETIKCKILCDCSHADIVEVSSSYTVLKDSHKLIVRDGKVITVLDRK